jgi:hypothetical protein
MRRNGKCIPLYYSKIGLGGGPYVSVDGVPMMATVDGNGAQWMRLIGASTTDPTDIGVMTFTPDNADGQPVQTLGRDLLVANRNFIFDGNDWDRRYSASAAVLATKNSLGAALSTKPGEWTAFQTPAVTTQATANRAAVAGTTHVCTSIEGSVSAVAAQGVLTLVVRDGATGVGAILWATNIGPFVIGTGGQFSLSGLNIPGTNGNAMTIEFTAAPAATNFESVAMTGYDATDAV